MQQAADKRVRRSQQALRSALLELMIERGYEHLSVQDVLDRADVGRATFYVHYRSKEDLLVRSMDILREQLVEASRTASHNSAQVPLGFTLAFFRHVGSHRPLWRAIVGRESGFIVERQMRRLLLDVVRPELKGFAGSREKVSELSAHYIVGALMAVMTWWLDRNPRLSPEEVDSLFRRMAVPGLRALRD